MFFSGKGDMLSMPNICFYEKHISWNHIFSVGSQEMFFACNFSKGAIFVLRKSRGPVFKATRPSCRYME